MAAVPVPATFSWLALVSMLTALAASSGCFAWLCRRWTTGRPQSGLNDWACDRRFRLDRMPSARLPAGLSLLLAADPRVDVALVRGPVTVVRLTTTSAARGYRPLWHLLVRTTDRSTSTDPAGLRPVVAPVGRSMIDLLPSLTGYPSLLPPDRFAVHATDVKPARHLAASAARGLLPHDVGLLVHGPVVILDFTNRPFDGVEFDRMLVVAEQVAGHMQSE
jgi:hypothetical protein